MAKTNEGKDDRFMATLVINYDSLTRVANNASNLSSKAETYANDLTTKVYNKFSDISGGSSTYTADAKYYVKAKINALEAKKNSYATLSTQINTFVETAKRIDEQVESAIAINQETFLSNNEHLRIDDWKASILNWLTDLKNSCPVFEIIGNALKEAETAITDLIANIKYWYMCEGGKEWFAIFGSIVWTAACIMVFAGGVMMFPGGAVAIIKLVADAITLGNAVTNIYTSIKSYISARDGDPAWAKIYGNQDTMSDVLRQTNFNNGLWNKLSYVGATTLDNAKLFCDAVNLVDSFSKLASKFGFIQNYFNKNNGGLLTYFKEAKYTKVDVFDELGNKSTKWIMSHNDDGIVETHFTPSSIWRGIKAFVLDKPIDCNSDIGIRTLLANNFKTDFSVWKRSFSLESVKETFVYNATDGNRISFDEWKSTFNFQGIKDAARYNITYTIKGIFASNIPKDIRGKNIKTAGKAIKNVMKFISGDFDIREDVRRFVLNYI